MECWTKQAWDLAEPVSDFIQKLPDTGAPASEKTEVKILYNDETLYIGAHCWDSARTGRYCCQ